MKKKDMLALGIAVYLLAAVILAVSVYYSRDSVLWREGLWWGAYLELMLFVSLSLTLPILLFAVAVGVWFREDKAQPQSPAFDAQQPPRQWAQQPAPVQPAEPQGAECPNCGRWVSVQHNRCSDCDLPVANMARVREMQKRLREGRLTRQQYERAVQNLMR